MTDLGLSLKARQIFPLDSVNHLVYTIRSFMNVKMGISFTCRYSAAYATGRELGES